MGIFRKKPVEVEAVQLTWQTWNEVCELIGEFPDGMKGVYVDPNTGQATDIPLGDQGEIGLEIPTLEGTMLARQGDWIIKDNFTIYPCKPEPFEHTYEPVT